jgi:hypothetical protein
MRHLRVPLSCPKFFRVHYITGQMEYDRMFIITTQNRISFGALASFYCLLRTSSIPNYKKFLFLLYV